MGTGFSSFITETIDSGWHSTIYVETHGGCMKSTHGFDAKCNFSRTTSVTLTFDAQKSFLKSTQNANFGRK